MSIKFILINMSPQAVAEYSVLQSQPSLIKGKCLKVRLEGDFKEGRSYSPVEICKKEVPVLVSLIYSATLVFTGDVVT